MTIGIVALLSTVTSVATALLVRHVNHLEHQLEAAAEAGVVSGSTRALPWIVLGIGLGVTSAIGLLFELNRRRRDAALSLVSDLESKNVELDASEERYRQLVEELPLVTYVQRLGDTRSLLYVSPQVANMLGYTPEELLHSGRKGSLIHEDDLDRVRAAIAYHADGEGTLRLEYRLLAKDGTHRWVVDESLVQVKADGSLARRGYWLDVTEHKQLENRLNRAHRMEAVGQLAGGVAHDFNNLLTAVTTSASFLLSDLDPDDVLRDEAEAIRGAAERASDLTQQLLAFSSRQILQPETLDVNEVVGDLERMLRRVIGDNVQLVAETDAASLFVQADPGQLEQVVVNLAVNARDAMPGGGKLTIETGELDVDAGTIDNGLGWEPGQYAWLAVTDTGIGMDESTLEHIFEPFFTTKEHGNGTGLGLATVYGIVQQSGGQISVYSEPGQGTTFKVYLPMVVDPGRRVGQAASVAVGDHSETVLLVEDHDDVRVAARKALERRGYKVVEAADGVDAVAKSASSEHAIDMLLTDVVMPGMSGAELAEELRASQPDLPVVFMSGYADPAVLNHRVIPEGSFFLSKPFTPETLARKLDDALAALPGRDSV